MEPHITTYVAGRPVLAGGEAMRLWRAGEEQWNAWVADHPDVNIDFRGQDFTGLRDFDASSYSFPQMGDVNFSNVNFGEGDVNFSCVTFGEGYVNFSGATFGKGYVDFSGATFGNGKVNFSNVNFSNVNFGDGRVDFKKATFGEGYVDFSEATFGEGYVDFSEAKFGEGVDFSGATFGKGYVNFSQATFDKGNVIFCCTEFGAGDVNFSDAKFGDGDVRFNGAIFGGEVFFEDAVLGSGEYSFERSAFSGHVRFKGLCGTEKVKGFSLRYASFAKSLSFSSNVSFGCVPDLTNTHIGYHASLNGLTCQPQATTHPDIERLCRLKELAHNNQDTERALAFKALELRAIRKHAATGIPWFLNWSFDFFSDYGRSEWRPAIGLLVVWLVFGVLYQCQSLLPEKSVTQPQPIADGFVLSASQMFPLIPGLRKYDKEGTPVFALLNLMQSTIALVFLFLLVLALRNRFRL